MYIIPAIDLLKGKCVRLLQGNYHRQLTYEKDPVKQAQKFISQGAKWLHVIDLEGAKTGNPVNTQAIKNIATIGKLKIEVGGGLRDETSIRQLLDIGIERVIIGTKAVSDFDWFTKITQTFKGKIVLGIDARGLKVATEGWTKSTPQNLIELAKQAAKLPITAIIYTDITKDGMLSGPNLKRTKALVEAVDIPIIASGGVQSTQDIKKLADCGVRAVVIGRALYEGTLRLSEAINAAISQKNT